MAETLMVPGGGIEPPFSAPKTAVLPLDDPGMDQSTSYRSGPPGQRVGSGRAVPGAGVVTIVAMKRVANVTTIQCIVSGTAR